MPLIENQSFSSTPQASMTPYQKMEFQKNLAPKIQLDDATVEEVGSVNSDMIEMSDMSPPQSEKENIGTFKELRLKIHTLTLTRPIGLPPHAPVAPKIVDQR